MTERGFSVEADWREGLSEPLLEAIERAIKQFHADEAYEADHGKLADTIGHLQAIGEHGAALLAAIAAISPVGMAAIHEEGMRRGILTGRYELGDISQGLKDIPEIAPAAAELLLTMHSPLPDEGQGAGSAVGRDSDLRAIKAEHDRWTSFAFRSPKDKLGVAVVKAVLRHDRGFDHRARGSARKLERFLERVWNEIRADELANWKRVVSARAAIAELVERSLRSEAIWKRVVANGNASSRKQERRQRAISTSYSIALGQPGGTDVDVESEGGGQPAGAQRQHP
jgi:hypothetical protein